VKRLEDKLRNLPEGWLDRIEVVYASGLMREGLGRPGIVEYSPIDIARFTPPSMSERKEREPSLVVGRLCRDDPGKFHPEDPALFKHLAANGCVVRIMGGTCLRRDLEGVDGVSLLPEGAMDAAIFLRGLDCFLFRNHPSLVESFGRAVVEAMACGLPVVCHRNGGYAELIRHGINGFLFDTTEQAMELLLTLQRDKNLRATIGKAARATVEEIYSPEKLREMWNFYIGSE